MFRMARGWAKADGDNAPACELTKWFNTNYHYIVPELPAQLPSTNPFRLTYAPLLHSVEAAKKAGHPVKACLVGPLTYLWLSKVNPMADADAAAGTDAAAPQKAAAKLDFLQYVLEFYETIFSRLDELDVAWLQLDEPILSLDLPDEWQEAIRETYAKRWKTTSTWKTVPSTAGAKEKSRAGAEAGTIAGGVRRPKILFTSYFGPLNDNLQLLSELAVEGVHLDLVAHGLQDRDGAGKQSADWKKSILAVANNKVLSLGLIDGRNVWRADLKRLLNDLLEIEASLKLKGENQQPQFEAPLWVSTSCSLLHCPRDLSGEQKLDAQIKSWLSFATEKCREVAYLAMETHAELTAAIAESEKVRQDMQSSSRIHRADVKARMETLNDPMFQRKSPYAMRGPIQRNELALPLLPTTTIGSFPQTANIRKARGQVRKGQISNEEYEKTMHHEIDENTKRQLDVGLDVLVHGEPERNDMVEYFGEHLQGMAVTEQGWVQSYGSRCVKPPIIYGDIAATESITVKWISYASQQAKKPVKGMLTGPTTILCWSFPRVDVPRQTIAYQLALALRDEIDALVKSGTSIIQIDEPAFREGLPLRQADQAHYLQWSTKAFRLASSGVEDRVQIHTHMCYSYFNDIISAITDLDADVISIECSRSQMRLLSAFEKFAYPNEIGPGVYDIHSPLIPSAQQMIELLERAIQMIPIERLWVNPDCGLKTRQWEEVMPALRKMVAAAKELRSKYA